MKKLKKLAIGVSDFRQLIKRNYLYVDKTEYIYKLLTSTQYNFLSRPRRFGKSLFISILNEIFIGNKELFKDLWIYSSDWEWKKHPVIRIDFNNIKLDSAQELEQDLINLIESYAKQYNIEISQNISIKRKFNQLIIEIAKKYNQSVVVLIDEYDKPIINHIGKGEEGIKKAEENREIIKELYGVLKSGEVSKVLRFLLLTGISKFSKISVFSELNNLKDLTMDKKYELLLGISEEELESYFKDYIEILREELGLDYENTKKELKNYYNGYRFTSSETKVFNPFSILNCFDSKELKNFWFESGTPTFLPNLLAEQRYNLFDLEGVELLDIDFSSYDIKDLSINAIMFQTGYLTIKDYDKYTQLYTLAYPNKEVRLSFIRQLYKRYSQIKTASKYMQINRHLNNNELDKFIDIINSIYAEIPYTLMKKNLINEAYFHTMFYLMVSASGIIVETEVLTSQGCIDMVVIGDEFIYIFEFKCNQSAKKAIAQIKEKNYIERYKHLNKKIITMGINFDPITKKIKEHAISRL